MTFRDVITSTTLPKLARTLRNAEDFAYWAVVVGGSQVGAWSADAVRGETKSVSRQIADLIPTPVARALFPPLRWLEAMSNFDDDVNGVGNAVLAWSLPVGRPKSLAKLSKPIFSERFRYARGFDVLGIVTYASKKPLVVPLQLWRCDGAKNTVVGKGEIRLPATKIETKTATKTDQMTWCNLDTIVYWNWFAQTPPALGPVLGSDFRVSFGGKSDQAILDESSGRPLEEGDAYFHVRPSHALALAAGPDDEPEDVLCSVMISTVQKSAAFFVHDPSSKSVPVDVPVASEQLNSTSYAALYAGRASSTSVNKQA